MGDPNASIPTPQPVYTRPMFAAFGRSVENSAICFVSQAKHTEAAKNTRTISKVDMVMNSYQPEIEVHPETYEVRADGELLTCDPAAELPMTQRYFLF